ncbi:IS66 family transposase [Desulfitobacterium sp. AusDCA]
MKNMSKSETSNAEMITISRSEYEALKEQNAEQSRQIGWLMQQIRLGQKKRFGSSSERMQEEVMEQLSFLFNEAEAYTLAEQPEKTEVVVAAHARKKRSGSLAEILPDNVPVEVVEHRLPEEERICSACDTIMQEIGKEIRRTLVIIPAQVKIREDWYFNYACQTCKTEALETPVLKTQKDKPVISGSFASPEAIAHIMTQKFVMGSPLYRQEQELNRSGVMLSRQTMSSWILRASEDWLKPVYEELHRQLVLRSVLHADETTLQVLREPDKKAQAKSYMWLYRTGGDTERPIVLYEYRPDRKAENPKRFLEGFSGYLHADGYQGYYTLPENITVVSCLAHARRKFDEAVNSLPKSEQKESSAIIGQQYCSKLFSIEERLKCLSPEERYTKRLELEKPVLDAFLAWAQTRKAAPKSALGKALHYLQEQWPHLTQYLKDGRLEISNNRAERSIKPFVMGRKNFLFANTPNGAQGSAVMFSLIETAKENNLDPYRYLVYVLTTAPNLDRTQPNWVTQLLPTNAPVQCRVPHPQSKCDE